MAHYIKQGNFSKAEFTEAIAALSTAKSINGAIYSGIRCSYGQISGIRESTQKSFTINLDELYRAYVELREFSTPALKPYVSGKQSPSLAILIAIGAAKIN